MIVWNMYVIITINFGYIDFQKMKNRLLDVEILQQIKNGNKLGEELYLDKKRLVAKDCLLYLLKRPNDLLSFDAIG